MIDLSANLPALLAEKRLKTKSARNPLDPAGDREDEIYHPGDFAGMHASLVLLLKQVGDLLEKTYPGWLWKLSGDGRNGVIRILSGRLHPNYGVTLHIDKIHNDPRLALVREYAGQLLERFGMPRRPFWLAAPEYRAARRNVLGYVVPDLQDKRSNQLMLTERREQGRKT